MKKIMIVLAFFGVLTLIGCENEKAVQSDKLNIIFETDIGNDVDDAMALDMMYKYLDQDKINVWAVTIFLPGITWSGTSRKTGCDIYLCWTELTRGWILLQMT